MSQDLDQHNSWWLQQDGKTVLLDGIAHVIRVSTYRASYPYERDVISVQAEPVNKTTQYYLAIKKVLGDDWSTDVLASGPSFQTQVMQLLQQPTK